MIELIIYFFLSYCLVVIISYRILSVKPASMDQDAPRYMRLVRIKLVLIIILFLLPFAPYGVVELQTKYLGASLTPITREALRKSGYEDHISNLKVLRVTPGRATVYAVTPCLEPKSCYRACVIHLVKVNSNWKFNEGWEEIVWSNCGSADGNIFPPYPYEISY